jgi:1,4-alpha-glucan branching enzyme
MIKGYFTFVLHSHLPYVLGHGKWPHGTDWLNEAAAETYIPLLKACNSLLEKGVSPKFTIGISPVLCEQLAHRSFIDEFSEYLEQKIEAAGADATEFYRTGQKEYHDLARMWEDFYKDIKTIFNDRYNKNLIGEFKRLQDEGHIEIITCGATHGYMPLLSQDISCQVQVKAAKNSYKNHFGREPRGIWLPECAYRPSYKWSPPVKTEGLPDSYTRKGIEEFLSENGLQYFFVDSATLKGGKAIGVYVDRFEALKTLWGVFEKQYVPRDEDEEKSPQNVYLAGSKEGKMPVGVFTRDPESSLQVWSGEWGYPGDGNYLDFHKKRFPGGHRYWKVTSAKSDLADKQVYTPELISDRINENASHFVNLIKGILSKHHEDSGNPGILVAPFDSELFGHWWFEGPGFLEKTIEKIGSDGEIGLCTAGEYYDISKPSRIVSLPEGSWGEGGYHYIWFNEWTEWTWKHIYEDELKMIELAKGYDKAGETGKRIIAQAGRELLLLSASDWQFLISTGRAESLSDGEREYLADLEKRDDIFPDFDPRWFEKIEFP